MLALDLSGVDNDSHLVSRVAIGLLDGQGLGHVWSSIILDNLEIKP